MPIFDINNLLLDGVMSSASDIHICAGAKPALRINGTLVRRPYAEQITKEDMDNVIIRFYLRNSSALQRQRGNSISSFNFSSGPAYFKQRFRGKFLNFERGNPFLALRIITR